MSLLTVENLSISFGDEKAPFKAVDRVSYTVNEGEVLGIVGESGSGKSVSSLAIMGLIDFPGRVTAEKLHFNQNDLLALKPKEKQKIIGADIAMIFQDAMTSLNPSYTVGYQIMEALKVHQGGSKAARRERAIELLSLVGIQIIDLLLELQRKENMALILITHDLALVAESAHRIIVMYAGQVVEEGRAEEIFKSPLHPYTQALLKALPEFAEGKSRLQSLPGVVPGKYDRPQGCLLNPRCPYATEKCRTVEPELIQLNGRQVKCHTPLNAQGLPS